MVRKQNIGAGSIVETRGRGGLRGKVIKAVGGRRWLVALDEGSEDEFASQALKLIQATSTPPRNPHKDKGNGSRSALRRATSALRDALTPKKASRSRRNQCVDSGSEGGSNGESESDRGGEVDGKSDGKSDGGSDSEDEGEDLGGAER